MRESVVQILVCRDAIMYAVIQSLRFQITRTFGLQLCIIDLGIRAYDSLAFLFMSESCCRSTSLAMLVGLSQSVAL